MKQAFSCLLAILLLLSTLSATAFAEGESDTTVYVTISDDRGKLVLIQKAVSVTDIDTDGALTIADALYAAHEAGYEGGAAAGFAYSEGAYGPQLDKLWGIANGGSYGYCVNNASAMSLGDTVKNGDYLNAYAYTDLTAWSDQYSYFDVCTATVTRGESLTLTLSTIGYGANYEPMILPVENATVTVDGVATTHRTDAEGKVTLTPEETGTHVISATSDTLTLVPPVCAVTVNAVPASSSTEADSTQPGGETADVEPKPQNNAPIVITCVAVGIVAVAAVVAVILVKRKK